MRAYVILNLLLGKPAIPGRDVNTSELSFTGQLVDGLGRKAKDRCHCLRGKKRRNWGRVNLFSRLRLYHCFFLVEWHPVTVL
jgi:hypothetical protein